MTKLEEKSLLKKAKKGNINAFEILVNEHQKKVYNLALKFSKNHEDALDLAQEALLKAYRNIQNFKGNSLFSTWVYKITTNICIDHYRKTNNIQTVYIDEEVKNNDGDSYKKINLPSLSDPESECERKELRGFIISCLDKIPIELKSVIVLKDIQGFSYEEISQILDIPMGTVKSRINRARTLMRKHLSENESFLNIS